MRSTPSGPRPTVRSGRRSSVAGRPAARPTRCPTGSRRSATCASSPRCSAGPGGTRRAPWSWVVAATCSAPSRAAGSSSRRARGSRITRAWSIGSSPERRPAISSTCTGGWDSRRLLRPARTCAAAWTRGALTPFRSVEDAAMRVYLFGFASDDFLGRVVVTPDERTVAQLADQLVAWGLAPERGGSLTVRNEAGDVLDPAATIAEAGLGNGDIFKVERG